MTPEELRFLKEEIDAARVYLEEDAGYGTDEWDQNYVQFEDLLNVAEVLWEACRDHLNKERDQ